MGSFQPAAPRLLPGEPASLSVSLLQTCAGQQRWLPTRLHDSACRQLPLAAPATRGDKVAPSLQSVSIWKILKQAVPQVMSGAIYDIVQQPMSIGTTIDSRTGLQKPEVFSQVKAGCRALLPPPCRFDRHSSQPSFGAPFFSRGVAWLPSLLPFCPTAPFVALKATRGIPPAQRGINVQYIMEGLTAGFMFCLGGGGFILIDLAQDKNR